MPPPPSPSVTQLTAQKAALSKQLKELQTGIIGTAGSVQDMFKKQIVTVTAQIRQLIAQAQAAATKATPRPAAAPVAAAPRSILKKPAAAAPAAAVPRRAAPAAAAPARRPAAAAAPVRPPAPPVRRPAAAAVAPPRLARALAVAAEEPAELLDEDGEPIDAESLHSDEERSEDDPEVLLEELDDDAVMQPEEEAEYVVKSRALEMERKVKDYVKLRSKNPKSVTLWIQSMQPASALALIKAVKAYDAEAALVAAELKELTQSHNKTKPRNRKRIVESEPDTEAEYDPAPEVEAPDVEAADATDDTEPLAYKFPEDDPAYAEAEAEAALAAMETGEPEADAEATDTAEVEPEPEPVAAITTTKARAPLSKLKLTKPASTPAPAPMEVAAAPRKKASKRAREVHEDVKDKEFALRGEWWNCKMSSRSSGMYTQPGMPTLTRVASLDDASCHEVWPTITTWFGKSLAPGEKKTSLKISRDYHELPPVLRSMFTKAAEHKLLPNAKATIIEAHMYRDCEGAQITLPIHSQAKTRCQEALLLPITSRVPGAVITLKFGLPYSLCCPANARPGYVPMIQIFKLPHAEKGPDLYQLSALGRHAKMLHCDDSAEMPKTTIALTAEGLSLTPAKPPADGFQFIVFTWNSKRPAPAGGATGTATKKRRTSKGKKDAGSGRKAKTPAAPKSPKTAAAAAPKRGTARDDMDEDEDEDDADFEDEDSEATDNDDEDPDADKKLYEGLAEEEEKELGRHPTTAGKRPATSRKRLYAPSTEDLPLDAAAADDREEDLNTHDDVPAADVREDAGVASQTELQRRALQHMSQTTTAATPAATTAPLAELIMPEDHFAPVTPIYFDAGPELADDIGYNSGSGPAELSIEHQICLDSFPDTTRRHAVQDAIHSGTEIPVQTIGCTVSMDPVALKVIVMELKKIQDTVGVPSYSHPRHVYAPPGHSDVIIGSLDEKNFITIGMSANLARRALTPAEITGLGDSMPAALPPAKAAAEKTAHLVVMQVLPMPNGATIMDAVMAKIRTCKFITYNDGQICRTGPSTRVVVRVEKPLTTDREKAAFMNHLAWFVQHIHPTNRVVEWTRDHRVTLRAELRSDSHALVVSMDPEIAAYALSATEVQELEASAPKPPVSAYTVPPRRMADPVDTQLWLIQTNGDVGQLGRYKTYVTTQCASHMLVKDVDEFEPVGLAFS